MKIRRRIETPGGITSFDMTAPIVPKVGGGGVRFDNTLRDFEYLLTEHFFTPEKFPDLTTELDQKYLMLTLKWKDDMFQIPFDIITGEINHLRFGEGYTGSFQGTLKVGDITKGPFFTENDLGFDLDEYWFSRIPFDGLVIYPPSYDLRESCWDAGMKGKRYPEFTVDAIFLFNPVYTKKNRYQ